MKQKNPIPGVYLVDLFGRGSTMDFFSVAWERTGKWYVGPKSGFTVALSPTDTTWLSILATSPLLVRADT